MRGGGLLGDHFPPEQRAAFVDTHIVPGEVLWLCCQLRVARKDKFVVLLCVGEVCLLFAVNSQVSQFIADRPELFACQVRLYASDYDFLTHDSFLDCSYLLRLSLADVRSQLLADLDRVRGAINEATRAQVVAIVRTTRVISPREKDLILGALAT